MNLAELMTSRGIEDFKLYDGPTGAIVADADGTADDPEGYTVKSGMSAGPTNST